MTLFAEFACPPVKHRPTAIWIWNHSLDRARFFNRLADFLNQGFGCVVATAAPALFAGQDQDFLHNHLAPLVSDCAAEAARLGLSFQFREEIHEEVRKELGPFCSIQPATDLLATWKRLSEYHLASRGVLPPHIALDSLAGPDAFHPMAAFSCQQPWWGNIRPLNDRLARLQTVMRQGDCTSLETGNADILCRCCDTGGGSFLLLVNCRDVAQTATVNLPAAGRVYCGCPETGTWRSVTSCDSDFRVEKGDAEERLLHVQLAPVECSLLCISEQIPEQVENMRSERLGEVEAALLLPDEFTVYLKDAAYLPLRNWQMEAMAASKNFAVIESGKCTGASVYRTVFSVQDIPSNLALVTSACGRLDVNMNGMPVDGFGPSPYLDSTLQSVDITGIVRYGENQIEVRYPSLPGISGSGVWFLAGDFSLENRSADPCKTEWVLADVPVRLKTGTWADSGFPFLAGTLVYRRVVNIPETFRNRSVFLAFEQISGSVAVAVDGESSGSVSWPPWELPLPGMCQPGSHCLEIAVTGSLRCLMHSAPSHDSLGLLDSIRLIVR